MNEALQNTKTTLEHILALLGVKADISEEQIGGEAALQIDTTDQALLIGRGGDNLKALQYIIYQVTKQKQLDLPMVTIDVAGYRKARLRQLDVMVALARTQAINDNEPVKLAPMNAYERRYVHSSLSNYPDVTSESTGQEPARQVVIRKNEP